MKHYKKNNNHFGRCFSFSVLFHLSVLGLLLYGAFFTKLVVSSADGDNSIKAIMVDLSVFAAPEQSLVEDTPLIESNDDNSKQEIPTIEDLAQVDDTDSEVKPDIIVQETKIEQQKPEPKDLVIQKEKPQLTQKKVTPKQPPSKPMVKQEIKSETIADVVTAAASSENTVYSALPTPISRNQPEYPRKALDMRITGHVVAIYDVDNRGQVVNIRIVEAKPNNIFNQTVISAMQRWKYQPIAAKDLSIKIVFNRNRSIQFS